MQGVHGMVTIVHAARHQMPGTSWLAPSMRMQQQQATCKDDCQCTRTSPRKLCFTVMHAWLRQHAYTCPGSAPQLQVAERAPHLLQACQAGGQLSGRGGDVLD